MANTDGYIGMNANNADGLLSYSGGSSVNSSSNGGIWQTIFGTTLPALFQYGGATLASTRNARAQETIAQRGGLLNTYFPNTMGMMPRNNSWIWILLALAVLGGLFFLTKKK